MKLSRLRTLGTLAVAGTLTGATLVLAASQASAMPTDGFVDGCVGTGGRVGIGTYYDFDVNGNVVSQNQVLTCRWGSSVRWNETDIHGNPYGELVRSIFRIACRAHFGPGLWPYAHFMPDDDDRAREIMNAFFAPTREGVDHNPCALIVPGDRHE